MFVYVYYDVVFARAFIGTKTKGYLVHNNYKSPTSQTSNKLFNEVDRESISAIIASCFWAKLEIYPFHVFWLVKELFEYFNFINVVPHY
jgi:hypothetical protein